MVIRLLVIGKRLFAPPPSGGQGEVLLLRIIIAIFSYRSPFFGGTGQAQKKGTASAVPFEKKDQLNLVNNLHRQSIAHSAAVNEPVHVKAGLELHCIDLG